jgi:hypothetical protein
MGPAGPAGSAATVLNEETAVVPVANLRLKIDQLATFRPVGISRVAIDIEVVRDLSSSSSVGLAVQHVTFPPIKVMLGSDAPLAQLQSLWNDVLQGDLVEVNAVLDLQAQVSKGGFENIWKIDMPNSVLIGFSNGTVSPAYMVIQPTVAQLSKSPQSLHPSVLQPLIMALPLQSSPVFAFSGSPGTMGLNRISGGETYLALTGTSTGSTQFPAGELRKSDLAVTLSAASPNIKLGTSFEPDAYDSIYTWIDALTMGGTSPTRNIELRPTAGSPTPTLHQNVIPTRITLINPLLVDPTSRFAPYVFDMVLRLEP